MALKINGRDAKAGAKPPRPRKPNPAPVNFLTDWDGPYADPFPEPTVSDPALAASWLAEHGIWTAQYVSETAVLAWKLDRLNKKLSDPALADNPHRPDAVKKARRLEDDLIGIVRDACWTEAHADRTWQALTPKQRRHADAHGHWQTDPNDVRLIGAVMRLATFETWPRFFRIRRVWFIDWPALLIRDMKDAGYWAWRPTADPPDPFGGETFFSATLAQELDGRR